MNGAIRTVWMEGKNFQTAALEYRVPRTMLQELQVCTAHSTASQCSFTLIKSICSWSAESSWPIVILFAKSYLEKAGFTRKFKNNLPTVKYMDFLMQRYTDLRLRRTSLIKQSSKAAVSRE
jgi:hypothetical protein